MNIYLVTRTDNWSYNDYDSFVVCCKDEDTARRTHPKSLIYEEHTKSLIYEEHTESWYLIAQDGAKYSYNIYEWVNAKDINDLKVEHIGVANENIKPGVIISSYNNG